MVIYHMFTNPYIQVSKTINKIGLIAESTLKLINDTRRSFSVSFDDLSTLKRENKGFYQN